MFRKLLVVTCLSFIVGYSSFAQSIGDYTLRRGVGARAAGMGSAYTAIADDGSAIFYNPAGLSTAGFAYAYGRPDSEEKNISGSYELFRLGSIGYGRWGFTNSASQEASLTAIGFGNRSGWLSWGLNYKQISWNLSGTKIEGFTSDIGFLARITPQLNIGLVAQDILTSKNTLMPASGRLGLAYKPLDGNLVLASDLELNNNGASYVHFGMEANVAQGLSIRGGIDREDTTAGLSLDLGAFNFNYVARFPTNGQTIHGFDAGLQFLPKSDRPFSIIKPKEYVLIDINSSIKAGRDEISLLGGYHKGLDTVLSQIRAATKDKGIDGIMLKISGFGGGLGGAAMVQEMRSELIRAKKSGKKIVAYVEGSALGDEYYLASVADKIVAPPGAAIGGLGKSVAVYRFKGLYEKIGVNYQVFKLGKYKNAFDPYSDEMTKDQKEMVQGLVADISRQMLTDIAKDRKIDLEEVKKLGDADIYTASEALDMNLIDEIGYYQDAKKLAAQVLGDDKDDAQIVAPKQVVSDETFLTQVFGVAVIEVEGTMVSGKGGENMIFGGRYNGSDTIAKYIRQASDDVFVKAIILRINSGGGDAIAAGEIYKALQYAKEKEKVVIASFGNVAASGGYYIAAATDKIVADPSTITGSIGIIGYHAVYKDLFEKLDIKAQVVKEGKHADMFSGLRNLTTDEVAIIEKLQRESYKSFIQAVVTGRGLSTEEVEELAQGKIYTGSQALELKLIDQLGGFSAAVDLAKQEAKIIGEPRLIFYREPGFFFPFGAGLTESLGLQDLSLWPLLLSPRPEALTNDLQIQ